MKNGLKWVLIIMGVAAVGISFVITLISASQVNIIGGAGWPTLWFYLQKYGWLTGTGALLILVGILAKKNK